MRILVVANTADPETGYVGDALVARDAELVVVYREAADFPLAIGDFDAVLSLGSESSVNDRDSVAGIGAEADLLRQAHSIGRPVLGLCFGAQLLAHALGGTVNHSPSPELGWYAVETDVPDLIPPGPFVQWHYDRFTPPPGARELARSSAGSQAFVLGRSLGVQFHPEATVDVVRRWCKTGTAALARHDVNGDTMIAESERQEASGQARSRADRVVETFLAGIPSEFG